MTLDQKLVAAALPGYEIGHEIGRGGWGVVLRARHVALGREVAVKQLPRAFAADQSALDRFVDEARIIGQLDHPHIVKVYDFVEHEGMWLIVMEYLGGGTLWDRFVGGGVRADQACGIGLAVCSALEAAHEHGILHRDIKPENILFTADGVSRLGDFGIAKDIDVATRRTRAGEVVGTPTYMSPEQAMGDDVTPASDIYSLGVVLYELLAGRLPFDEARSPTQQLLQHVSEDPIPLEETVPELPRAIGDAVMMALEKRPADRYASAQAFGVSLAHAAGESFGARWLQNSGTMLMGGGRIGAAALRGPTMGAPVREPTMARPALREDHFRPAPEPSGAESSAAPTIAPSTPPPAAAPVTEPPMPAHAEISPPPTPPADADTAPRTPAEEVSSAAGAASAATPELAAPAPLADSVESDGGARSDTAPRGDLPPPASASPTARGGRRGLWIGLAVAGVAVVAAVGVVVALISGGGSGDDVAAVAATDVPATTAMPTTTATPTTTAEDDGASGIEVVVPPTTAEVRFCDTGARCAFIENISAEGDSLVVNWTPIGFEPSYDEGFFHAHFFWDIYSPDQVGTNASTFGVEQGEWEITDQRPFVSAGEMLLSNRPAPANNICVTVANFAHAVVDPLEYDCMPIPEDM